MCMRDSLHKAFWLGVEAENLANSGKKSRKQAVLGLKSAKNVSKSHENGDVS